MFDAAISLLRGEFHSTLLEEILTKSDVGTPSNADVGSGVSCRIASSIVEQLGKSKTLPKLAGQTAGSGFESICVRFISACFEQFSELRPGNFRIEKGKGIALFDQYTHLDELALIAKTNREIATAIGSDYLITPDIIIAKEPFSDEFINKGRHIVDAGSANLTSLRARNLCGETLHASISCKWTIRSDRVQNSRSEALNLTKNRKGRLPHIAVITGEPTPGRIASIVLGTGEIDCVYHFALPEMRNAVAEHCSEDSIDLLETMIQGKRLRDISDLPLDLII